MGVSVAMVASIALYLPHVLNGGWYLDDWINVALMRDAGTVGAALETMNRVTYRPGLSLSNVAFHTVAGETPSTYLLIGTILSALQAALFYLVLRALRLTVVVAAVAAVIFLSLPCIDSTRLWMSAFPIQVSGSLYLLGLLAAIHGVRRAGTSTQVVWHSLAVALFAAAMLTYELVAGLVLVSVLLYATQGGWKAAASRLPADWGCTAVVLYALSQRAVDLRGADTSLSHLWSRAEQMTTPAEQVFRTLIPWSNVLGGTVGLVLFVAGLIGAAIAIRTRSSQAAGLRAWLLVAAVSLIFTIAGLVMLLPADPYFIPRMTGLGNRVGAFAAFGAVVLLVALIVITCGGIGALIARATAGFAVAIAATAIAAVTLVAREIDQQEPWARAWDEQIAVLANINTAVGGRLPQTAAVVTFRHPTFLLPADVSVFAYSWDLRGALMNVFHAPAAMGHPWTSGSRCGTHGLVFSDGTGAPEGAGPYLYSDSLLFVDAQAGAKRVIRSRRDCETAVATLTGAS